MTITPEAFKLKFPTCHRKWLAYAGARLESEQMSAASKLATKKFRAVETELIDQMADDGVRGIPDLSGSFASTTANWAVKVNAENRIEVEEYLSQHYGDIEPFKTFVLDKWAIQAKLRADCEDDDTKLTEDQIPEFLELSIRPILKVNGWVKKKQEMET